MAIIKSIKNITDEPIFINGVEIGAEQFAYSFYSKDLFSNNGGDVSEFITRGFIELYDESNNLISAPGDFPALNETTDYINNLGLSNSAGQVNVVELDNDVTLNGSEEFVKVDTLASGVSITLPGLSGANGEFLGKTVGFKNYKGSNDVTINGFGSELVDGLSFMTLTPGTSVGIISDGLSWESTGVSSYGSTGIESLTQNDLLPLDVAVDYNPDETIDKVTKGAKVYTFSYDGEGNIQTISDGTYTKNFTYTGDGSVSSISLS